MDRIAAEEIAKQIAAMRPRVEGSRGVMAYLERPPVDKRSDVKKAFLASTIRGVNSHNRRQEEDKCWTLRRMEQKLDDKVGGTSSRRSRSRERRRLDKRKRRRSPSRSRSRSSSRRRSSRREERNSRRSRSRDRRCIAEDDADKKQEDEDERSFWAKKKAEKTRKLWENLHAEGTVSVENAPDFSGEESDDEDVKPPASPTRKEKKHKKHKKHSRKNGRKEKRRRSRS